MNNPEQVIIYLDIFAFLLLLAFFILLFKSSSLFINKKIMADHNLREKWDKEYLSKSKK